jgi:hypothetical protein
MQSMTDEGLLKLVKNPSPALTSSSGPLPDQARDFLSLGALDQFFDVPNLRKL